MNKREVFGHFFKSYYGRLYYYALQLLKDEEASRDIVSGVFAHVWENFSTPMTCKPYQPSCLKP